MFPTTRCHCLQDGSWQAAKDSLELRAWEKLVSFVTAAGASELYSPEIAASVRDGEPHGTSATVFRGCPTDGVHALSGPDPIFL